MKRTFDIKHAGLINPVNNPISYPTTEGTNEKYMGWYDGNWMLWLARSLPRLSGYVRISTIVGQKRDAAVLSPL